MVLGVFFVRPMLLPELSTSQSLEDGDGVRELLLPDLQHHNHSRTDTSTLNVHGKALLYHLDFWLLFSIFSMRMYSCSFFS